MSLFDTLNAEEEREIRECEIEKDPVLEEIIKLYRDENIVLGLFYSETFCKHFYDKMVPVARASTITAFSLNITDNDLQRWRESEIMGFYGTGFYLSALINKSPDKEHLIITKYLTARIGFLGYKNTKKVTINGNAGPDVGEEMSGGEIRLMGEYASISDSITGGSIYHKGRLIVKDGKKIILDQD